MNRKHFKFFLLLRCLDTHSQNEGPIYLNRTVVQEMKSQLKILDFSCDNPNMQKSPKIGEQPTQLATPRKTRTALPQ